jgi:hypothetical protein
LTYAHNGCNIKSDKGHMPYNKEAILWLEEIEQVLTEEEHLQEEA